MTLEDLKSINDLSKRVEMLNHLSENHKKDLISLDYSDGNDSENSVCLSIKHSVDSYYLDINKLVDLKCVTVRLEKLNDLLNSEYKYLTSKRDEAVEKFSKLTIK